MTGRGGPISNRGVDTMSNTIDAFFSAWSQTDAAVRRDAIAAALAPGGSYADPRTPAPMADVDAINDYVGMFAQAAPGATVAVVKSDAQHGLTRATVAFRMADGMEQTGQYFIETDSAGLITRMVGFVGTGEA